MDNKIEEATELLSRQQNIESDLRQLYINYSKRRQECRTQQAARKNLDRVKALETEYLDIEQGLQVLSPSHSRTTEKFNSLLNKTKHLLKAGKTTLKHKSDSGTTGIIDVFKSVDTSGIPKIDIMAPPGDNVNGKDPEGKNNEQNNADDSSTSDAQPVKPHNKKSDDYNHEMTQKIFRKL